MELYEDLCILVIQYDSYRHAMYSNYAWLQLTVLLLQLALVINIWFLYWLCDHNGGPFLISVSVSLMVSKSLLFHFIGAMADTYFFSSLLYTIYTPIYTHSPGGKFSSFLWGTTFTSALVHVVWCWQVTLMLPVFLLWVMEAWDPGPSIRDSLLVISSLMGMNLRLRQWNPPWTSTQGHWKMLA